MSLYTYKNFHTYSINTYMHIHTYVYVHTGIYTHTCVCAHTYMHACIPTLSLYGYLLVRHLFFFYFLTAVNNSMRNEDMRI